ncbi:MAG: hypothetical protein Q8N03_04095 [Ignavibacteria bacterium]|nr:hypothetical protein [Ignavibacteria bacterium]
MNQSDFNSLEKLQVAYKELLKKYDDLRTYEREKEKQYNSLVREALLSYEQKQKFLLREQEFKAEASTWQKIIDEMAHSINTDVYVAVSNLEKHRDIPRVEKAYFHIRQIRELTNLLMWYIKRNNLPLSNEMVILNLNEIISEQLETIKSGITTLRISGDDHEELLAKLDLAISIEGAVNVSINKEIKESIPLILKDFLRNAMKNTDEEKPVVSINLQETERFVEVTIFNNRAISKDYAEWFNGTPTNEPDGISKSSKVGLRVIKMWTELLKINTSFIPNYETNSTLTKIIFPKEIIYAQN